MQAILDTFARALDEEQFDEARACLSPGCLYDSPNGRVIGADAIIETYRSNAVWARRALDSVAYRHEMVPNDDLTATVTWIDDIRHRDLTHEYRCRQILTLDATGLICAIEHQELPGERERLTVFLESCDVQRPS